MFGFFKKKQPKDSEAFRLSSAIFNILNVQLTLCGTSERISDDWAIGYIGGFADGALQNKGIGTDEAGIMVMLLVFNSIFGEDKGIYFLRKYVHLRDSGNLATIQGENTGGNEAYSLLNGRSERAFGLSAYCLELEEPQTILDQIEEIGDKLIINGYRRLAAQNDCAPTEKTSDQQIVEIYKKVETAFREISEQRGEELSAGTLNNIAWRFINVREMLGSHMLDQHLNYELQKYLQEGLRPDYQHNIDLF